MKHEETIDLVYFSDSHGRLISEDPADKNSPQVGLDRLSTYLKQLRKKSQKILVIDNGDAIQGSPVVDLHDFNVVGMEKRLHPTNLMHQTLGVDCFIIGNHEFNFGQQHLNRIYKQSEIPWLSANTYKKSSNTSLFPPFTIKQFGRTKIGILGLVTEFVSRWENSKTIGGLVFKNVIETCNGILPELADLCDVLIVAYHGGLKRHPGADEIWTVADTNENQGLELWESFPYIDILLTAHQHRQLLFRSENQKRAVIIQPSYFAKAWVHVKLGIEINGSSKSSVHIQMEPGIVKSDDFLPDPEIREKLKPHLAYTESVLQTPLGKVDNSFYIENPMFDVWTRKHPIIEWINQLMCNASGVDISGIPLLDASLKGLRGDVTIGDILSFFFFQDTVCVIRVNGKSFLAALEKAAGFFVIEKEQNGNSLQINPDWKRGRILSYNYDMWNGIQYTFDLRNPIGSRLVKAMYHGEPINPDSSYDIAVTSYRSGGAFYNMFSPCQIIHDFPVKITDLMINDLLVKKSLRVESSNNFKIIY